MARPRRSRARLAAVPLALLLAAPLAGPGPVGAAPPTDPVAAKRAEAERVARELEQQGRQVSILAEQLDQARLQAGRLEAEVQGALAQAAAAERQVGVARARLRDRAVASYVQGGDLPVLALMAGASAADIPVRQAYVRTVAGQEREAIDALGAARAQHEERRGRLEAAQRSARQVLDQVDRRRRDAAAAADARRATLARVTGELAAMVEAEARRRAEEEARRVRAELAARQAREEAARRAREAAERLAGEEAARRPRPAVPDPDPVVSRPAAPPPDPAPGAGAAIAEARRQLGKPYEWGAAGPDSFDCSGLTQWAWRAGGRSLPHSSTAQHGATTRVALSDIAPGDLLFYGSPIHHVGLYVGDDTMIEASETGTPVRYASIYRRDMVGVGRVG